MSNDEESLSNAVKAALVGGAITFLLNAVVGVWVVSKVNTVNTVIQNELGRVRDAQTMIESDVAELEVQTSVLESRVNSYHPSTGDVNVGAGTTISFPARSPRIPSPRDSSSDEPGRGQALREEAGGTQGTK